MARGTHLRVLAPQPRRIEAGSVWIEATGAERRVARQTIALYMAADTGLQILARRLAMPQTEEPLGIVVS